MDGLSLCSALKADIRTSHVPVVLLTARSSSEAEYQGYEVGADAYISKPFNMNILLLRIKNLLEQQESRRSKYSKSIEIKPAEITNTGIDEKFIQKALELINSKMDNANYSVEQFSSDMNMERSGLYKKLVSITGQTPSGFIRSVRLKRAALLLKESGFSIGEIAEKVGFNNFAYFSKCFFEEFGVKPSQYRK
jgi:AraC-like DNA-binding protein